MSRATLRSVAKGPVTGPNFVFISDVWTGIEPSVWPAIMHSFCGTHHRFGRVHVAQVSHPTTVRTSCLRGAGVPFIRDVDGAGPVTMEDQNSYIDP